MGINSYEELVRTLEEGDIGALVQEKPKVLQLVLTDIPLLERVGGGVHSRIAAVRDLVYSAWFYAYSNSQTGESGLPWGVSQRFGPNLYLNQTVTTSSDKDLDYGIC